MLRNTKININKSNDPFYRYKMQSIMLKDEGYGNGLRTVILNLDEISNDLCRDPNFIIIYLSSVLGCKYICEQNDKKNKWILCGRYSQEQIQEYIYEFISNFVLCKQCQNPETIYEKVKNDVYLKCSACSKLSNISLNKHTMKVLKRV